MQQITTYKDIDWDLLRKSENARKSWPPKGPADWDKKAPSFAKRNSTSPFVDLVLQHLPLRQDYTVLDAGSGPGTITIPVAKIVSSVTALDYSPEMLRILNEESRKENLSNIKTINGSWNDDWDDLGITRHDICIASRSLSGPDLRQSLQKLDNYAGRHVFVVDRIGPAPFDRGAFAALDRPFHSGPDYIYTINMLYTMGIHCQVDIIALHKETTYPDMTAAMESYAWMFKELSADEELKLEKYILSKSIIGMDNSLTVTRDVPPRWAVISWTK